MFRAGSRHLSHGRLPAGKELNGNLRPRDRGIAVRARRDRPDLRTTMLFNELEIVLSLLRQLGNLANAFRRLSPSWKLLIEAFNFLVDARIRWYFIDLFTLVFVANANRNLSEFVEHIHLRHHIPVHAIEHGGIAQHLHVDPTTAPRTSRHRAEFLTASAQCLGNSVLDVGG